MKPSRLAAMWIVTRERALAMVSVLRPHDRAVGERDHAVGKRARLIRR
jgi:hypothetical protein